MRGVDKKVVWEVQSQLEKARSLKKQSTTLDTADGETEVATYWVGDVLRVDIKLPKVEVKE